MTQSPPPSPDVPNQLKDKREGKKTETERVSLDPSLTKISAAVTSCRVIQVTQVQKCSKVTTILKASQLT